MVNCKQKYLKHFCWQIFCAEKPLCKLRLNSKQIVTYVTILSPWPCDKKRAKGKQEQDNVSNTICNIADNDLFRWKCEKERVKGKTMDPVFFVIPENDFFQWKCEKKRVKGDERARQWIQRRVVAATLGQIANSRVILTTQHNLWHQLHFLLSLWR